MRRALCAPLALLLLTATAAYAQGVVDQENDPDPTTRFGCGTPPILNGSVMQGFVPSEDSLVGVALRLRAGDSFTQSEVKATVRILASNTDRANPLAVSTATVAGPMVQNEDVLVRFDFDAVTLTPGNTYVIEWVTPDFNVLGWAGNNDNTYAAGRLYSCSGNPWPNENSDANFITYAAAAEKELDCKSRLKNLLERVQDLKGTGRLRRLPTKWLSTPVRLACWFVERDRPHVARVMLRYFQVRVMLFVRWRCISHEDGLALLAEARAIQKCLP
ncbi:MAG: hypothetical protein ACYTFD_16770 [Planctomycetota bacterium]